ncbi:DUF3445 domain-containing protein [Actinoplanes sp. M2I2]|uniref:heme-dependent oxidative N-demethylase family protein n=1 Tax=Actinoplanes sp. M2I2 TaxID=1734444 RepID=UPI002020D5F6|nr:DUF3445 domain-containing protein [Actinoplanes sp. M2I2]
MSAETPPHRFAWPFDGQPYRFFTNVEPAGAEVRTAGGSWGATVFQADEAYPEVIAERREILRRRPRAAAALPHMHAAEWDALTWVFERFAAEHPRVATADLTDPSRVRWRNTVTGSELDLTQDGTAHPLAVAAHEVAEDLFLLDLRDGALRLDAVAATFVASWSSTFSLGMSFSDLHGPIPRLHGSGMVARTERFLRALQPGEVVRRLNWSMQPTGDLDASVDARHTWPGEDDLRRRVVADPGTLRLRIEIQHLTALPATGAILFTIATQLTPLARLVTVPEWRDQLELVLSELPEDMAAYKSFADVREPVLAYLSSRSAS